MLTSQGRRSGTTWRRASQHDFLKKTPVEERPMLRSSSPRPSRNCKKQEPCMPMVAHKAQLRILARMLGCVSASTS